mgnify:CR=1 FL=1
MSALDDLCSALTKTVGENDKEQSVTKFIDTGFPPLNKIISGRFDGGLPYGRIVEMYAPSSSGKTALATQWMVEAQRLGGIAIFIDWERSFDVELAKGFGLNTTAPFWIYKRPQTWEQGHILAIKVCKMVREARDEDGNPVIPLEAPILCVFDSIASAVPQSMVDKEMDEYNMNDTTALARVASTTLKSVAQHAATYNATLLYLNQVRTKPGVVYGSNICLRSDVMVPFVDGTTATISEIVDNHISKEVWALNESTGQLEPAKIVKWFNNGRIDATDKKWIHIRAVTPHTRNGVSAVTATNDHKILVQGKGWTRADQIEIGDNLVSRRIIDFDGVAREFLCGVIGFDAHVEAPHNTACLHLEDFNDPEYVKWKVEKLSKHLSFKKSEFKTKTGSYDKFVSNFSSELSQYKEMARKPHVLFKNGMTPLQLAIAIMDDGSLTVTSKEHGYQRYTLSVKRYKGDEEVLDAFAQILYDSFGLTFTVRPWDGCFCFGNKETSKIAELICEYVPECMKRKLPKEYWGRYKDFDLGEPMRKSVVEYIPVYEVRPGGGHHHSPYMYDIEVEGHHNFLAGNKANGFIVHNCTPGGTAMEYYATVRIQLSRKKLTEQKAGGKTFVGQTINIQCTKSKLTKPFDECTLDMTFDDNGAAHFDTVGSAVDYLIETKKIETSGPRIVWEGSKLFKKDVITKINAEGGMKVLKPLLTD